MFLLVLEYVVSPAMMKKLEAEKAEKAADEKKEAEAAEAKSPKEKKAEKAEEKVSPRSPVQSSPFLIFSSTTNSLS